MRWIASPRVQRWLGWRGAVLLLAGFCAISATSATRKSNTFDELIHLTGGYAMWRLGDHRVAVNADNGILPKRWAALPLLAMDLAFPSRADDAWLRSDHWEVADQFLFRVGNDPHRMLFRARMMILVLGALVGALVYGVARSGFGRAAGFVALTMFVFSPVIVAHSRLVTSDLITSGAFLLATVTGWRVLQEVTVPRLAASLLATGLLVISKTSGVLIGPIFVVMIVVRLLSGRRLIIGRGPGRRILRRRRHLAAAMAVLLIMQASAAWVAVWAGFGFRYSMYEEETRATSTFQVTEGREEDPGIAHDVLRFCRRHRLLPEGGSGGG